VGRGRELCKRQPANGFVYVHTYIIYVSTVHTQLIHNSPFIFTHTHTQRPPQFRKLAKEKKRKEKKVNIRTDPNPIQSNPIQSNPAAAASLHTYTYIHIIIINNPPPHPIQSNPVQFHPAATKQHALRPSPLTYVHFRVPNRYVSKYT